jgi:hypothetical protein
MEDDHRMASKKHDTPAKRTDATSLMTQTAAAAQAVEFRKANESIGLRVIAGRLSLLSRKLYNVFIAKAQEHGRPGLNAPVDEESAELYFWMPIADVVKDADYNSNDYDTLKEHAQELQNIKVIGESAKMWTSEQLLSGVKIYNTKGLKSKGGTVWLGFAFPPEVMQAILKPNTYTKLSLYYQTQLRSSAGLGLYEVARRYASSPSHLTRREPWEKWYYVISGASLDSQLPEYKYFKRDHLRVAINEINRGTDIEIELLEFREGRRVKEIQFKVFLKQQGALEIPAQPIINTAIINRIVELGVPKAEAATLYASYDEATIVSNLTMVENRIKRGPAVDSPAAYFKASIKNGYAAAASTTEPAPPKTVAKPKSNTIRERFNTARRNDAMRLFLELPAVDQKNEYQVFSKQADGGVKPFIKKGMESQIVRSAFGDWYATRLWGEPADSQIIDFLESEGLNG